MGERLTRIAIRYVAREDRICLTGALPGGAMQSVWLTARLLQQLLPRLLAWLEPHDEVEASPPSPAVKLQRELRQGVAQQRAMAAREAAPPLPAPLDPWLVTAVTLRRSRGLGVVLRGPEGHEAEIFFTQRTLRQWLGLLCDLWLRAGWPATPWPAWLLECVAPPLPPGPLH